jgi:hypothetical protein
MAVAARQSGPWREMEALRGMVAWSGETRVVWGDLIFIPGPDGRTTECEH